MANFPSFHMGSQSPQGHMNLRLPPGMMENMQDIIDKRVSELLSTEAQKELDKSESDNKHEI